jgi:hypothetical protein
MTAGPVSIRWSWPVIWALAGVALLLVALCAVARAGRLGAARAGAGGLLAALANPSLQREDRAQPLSTS